MYLKRKTKENDAKKNFHPLKLPEFSFKIIRIALEFLKY